MAHRNERNVDARSRKMPDDDDREERDRFVTSERENERRYFVRDDDDDEREERDRFVHVDERVRKFVGAMPAVDRERFTDERTRMFENEEPGRLFGGNRTFGSEERTRERQRSHGHSRFPERRRRR
jgi:hypothetical protein